MFARLPYASLLAVGAYAVVALVAFPEGSPSPLARLVAPLVIATAVFDVFRSSVEAAPMGMLPP